MSPKVPLKHARMTVFALAKAPFLSAPLRASLRRCLLIWVLCFGPVTAWAATCFAVDDDTARIVVFDRDAPANIRFNAQITNGVGGSAIGVERIEGAYFDSVQNRYYVVVQDTPNRFGYIEAMTGAFLAVASSMGTTSSPTVRAVGTGNAAQAIRGLTRNPVSNRWYVIEQNGFLYEINPTTGQFVSGAFGGADYLQVRGPTGTTYSNIEDLAFDDAGRLFVIRNDPSAEQLLRDVSLISGLAAGTANTGIDEAEGLALTSGDMRLIIGASGGANARNFYSLNTTTGATTLIFNLPSPTATPADYEAQGCNDSAPRADLSLKKAVIPSAVAPGGTFTYVLEVENQGIDPAFRVQIGDVLANGMGFVSITQGADCTTCTFSTAGSTNGTWTVDRLDIGSRRTLTLVVSTAGVPGNSFVTNRAQVTQSCNGPGGTCFALADVDSTPNNKVGAWAPSEDDEAVATSLVTAQPSVAKAFNSVSNVAGATTTLVLTLSNPNTATVATLTSPFTDTYPAGLVNASPASAATSCGSGSAFAAAGGSSVSLAAGATIPAGGACTLTAVVRASQVGTYTNTVPPGALAVSVAGTALSNAVGSTAQFQVTPANVYVGKDFTPDTIQANQTSTLILTFSNPTSVAAVFTSGFSDNYPAGLVNAAVPNAQTSCSGTGTPAATAGAGSVSLPATRAIPANGSCTLTVVVTSAAIGIYNNTVPAGDVVTSVGSNLATAAAALEVTTEPVGGEISVTKSFNPSVIPTGGTSTLILLFTNRLDNNADLTQIFTDAYPANVVNHSTPAATDTCPGGNVSAAAGAGSLSLPTGTRIPSNSSCTMQVVVSGSPIASRTGTFVNTVGAGDLITNRGNSTEASSATLTIADLTDLRITKVASLALATPGQTVSYVVDISNSGPSTASLATFSDLLQGLALASSVQVSPAGGGAVNSLLTSTISLSGTVTLPVGGAVSLRFDAVPTATGGVVTNTASVSPSAGGGDSNPGNNSARATTAIQPQALLTVSKTNSLSAVPVGGTTSYTLVFNNAGPSDASGTVVTDPPATGLSCTAVSCASTGGASCAGLTLGSLQGGHAIAAFPANSSLTLVLSCDVTASGS